jgi:hypothetical protein
MEIVKPFYARYDLINFIAALNNAKTYLEIGIYNGLCLNRINIDHKVGIDPRTKANGEKYCTVYHKMTSDKYFADFPDDKYDLIFIDGLHEAGQVEKDLANSLTRLNPGGAIVCHDMNPETPERENPGTNGNCWKAFVQLRAKATDLLIFTIDNDQGLGVILQQPGTPILLANPPKKYKYSALAADRVRLLDLVSTKAGLKRIEAHYERIEKIFA